MTTNKRDLRGEFDKFCNDNLPSEVVGNIITLSSYHDSRVSKLYGRFKEQFILGFDLLFRLSFETNYVKKDEWPTHRGAQFITFAHNLQTIYSAYNKLINGFYSDCSTLARVPYEALMIIIYISLHPNNDPYKTIAGINTKGQKKFNLTHFLKYELRVDWTEYLLLSASAHANRFSVLMEAVQLNGKKQSQPIASRIKFDSKLFEIGVNQLVFLILSYLKVGRRLLLTDHESSEERKQLLAKIDKYIELSETSIIETHPKTYWPGVVNDLNKIIKVVELSERNTDLSKGIT